MAAVVSSKIHGVNMTGRCISWDRLLSSFQNAKSQEEMPKRLVSSNKMCKSKSLAMDQSERGGDCAPATLSCRGDIFKFDACSVLLHAAYLPGWRWW